MNVTSMSLPLKSWIPYNVNTRTIFYLTYLYQGFALFYEGLLYTSMESLLTILMHHICSQLEILTIRFFEIANLRKRKSLKFDIYEEECKLVKHCVDHHVCIFSSTENGSPDTNGFVSLSIADEIYKMNWNSLSIQTKQKLIMIIMRANHPIQLTGSSVVVLSIETFFKVIKASYSSYNLLRNSN
ncbi:uncharacterized protein LOC122498068 [Leptopilina heterotoma]|uniref:uncharacterized protein LOC122498068 n=1 Tax=Leptopilina heterotoma TaxID=63436 RepID=UPI001CA95813|nr:uncharacterized protein LOC122498068 [Leptopilina heterotoma]